VKVKEGIEWLHKHHDPNSMRVMEVDVMTLHVMESLERIAARSPGKTSFSVGCVKGVQKEMYPWIEKVANGCGLDGKQMAFKARLMDKMVLLKARLKTEVQDANNKGTKNPVTTGHTGAVPEKE
jgi:hypothetical protein